MSSETGLVPTATWANSSECKEKLAYKGWHSKQTRLAMDDKMKQYLEEFFKMCYARIEKGAVTHKRDFEQIDLYQEIMEELADVSNYSFLEYVKIRQLQEKKARLVAEDEKRRSG